MPSTGRNSNKFGVIVAGIGLVAFLAACSSTPDASTDNGRGTIATAPAFVAAAKVPAGMSAQEFAASVGGTLIESGSTALGTSSTGTSDRPVFLAFDQRPLGTLSAGETTIVVEANIDRFLTSATLETLGESTVWAEGNNSSMRANGESTVWAEGESTVWAEADPTFWADGESTVWAEGESTVWAEGESSVWAESDHYYKWMPPNTDIWHQIELHEAHDEARNLGYDIIVAVIDTGVDMNHQWLAGSVSEHGWDFVDNDNDPSEEGSISDGSHGHGTSVAGIIRQIAPRATILPIRALSADGSGNVLDVVQAVYHAVDNGADIINLSLGGPAESPALTQALSYAVSQGIYVTTTAGNENEHRINYPGAIAHEYSRIISVTSVDVDDRKSSFANWHSDVEISAPGSMVYGPYPDNGIAAWSGTSMAAPAVAGALALALGENDLDVHRHRLESELLEESKGLNGRNRDYRGMLGEGRLDIEEFLDEVLD